MGRLGSGMHESIIVIYSDTADGPAQILNELKLLLYFCCTFFSWNGIYSVLSCIYPIEAERRIYA